VEHSTTDQATGTAADPQEHCGPWRVHIVMYDGVEDLDFAAPFEVFNVAGLAGTRPVEVRYVTADGPGPVRTQYGTLLQVEHPFAPQDADVLVVPGGGYSLGSGPGVREQIQRGVLPRALAAARRPGLTIAAVCTGTMLLSAAGLTRGRPCTTHHLAMDDLAAQGGQVKRARVVDGGDLVSAGGITSGLDAALWLVRRDLGADTAVTTETLLEYQARGTVWTRTPA
jgi:transcriptional regulator GlxA family with amidase domain